MFHNTAGSWSFSTLSPLVYRTEKCTDNMYLLVSLSSHSSPGSCQYYFKLTNQGLRTQRLYWRIDGSQQSKVGDLSGRTILPPISTSKKDTLADGSPLREKTVFSLSPSRVELFPGNSVDMVLSGSSDSPKVRKLPSVP